MACDMGVTDSEAGGAGAGEEQLDDLRERLPLRAGEAEGEWEEEEGEEDEEPEADEESEPDPDPEGDDEARRLRRAALPVCEERARECDLDWCLRESSRWELLLVRR